MTKQLAYLIGVPGAGKTALMRYTLRNVPILAQHSKPFAHIEYPAGVELGGIRPGFGGTDMLPFNCQPAVVAWLASTMVECVVAEGDRLANAKFFGCAGDLGWELTLFYLYCPDDISASRRVDRGSNQNQSWLAGRKTKVANLVESYKERIVWLDATMPLASLAQILLRHPAFVRIQGE